MTRTETKTNAGERSAIRSTSTATHAYCSRSTSCRCGQQLDMCARAHCPRCGRSLSRP